MKRSTIKTFLDRPIEPSSKPWLNIIIISLLVFFILIVFQPFGLYHFRLQQLLKIASLYTIATFVSTLLVAYIFPYIFSKFYNPSSWTVGKKILNQFILITLIITGNYIVSYILGFKHMPTAGSIILSYVVITLTVGVFPAFIIAFIEQNYSLKKNLEEAKKLNQRLNEKADRNNLDNIESSSTVITLHGTTKDSIKLRTDQIIYIESIGNYIIINYIDNNTVKQKQLRATLSSAEKELSHFSNFIRCHRAFLLNSSFILSAEGNSVGLQIQLKNIKEKIPVSRSYAKSFYGKF